MATQSKQRDIQIDGMSREAIKALLPPHYLVVFGWNNGPDGAREDIHCIVHRKELRTAEEIKVEAAKAWSHREEALAMLGDLPALPKLVGKPDQISQATIDREALCLQFLDRELPMIARTWEDYLAIRAERVKASDWIYARKAGENWDSYRLDFSKPKPLSIPKEARCGCRHWTRNHEDQA